MRGIRRPAVVGAAALGLVAAALVAGVGSQAAPTGAGSSEPDLLGPRPGKLTCSDWRQGSESERRGTIEQLTMLAGANANPQDVGPNRVLSEDDAYASLEGTCEHELARGFLLYEVYNRAAAFWPGLAGS